VVRQAAKLGIHTPVNETLLGLVKTLEESYTDRIKA
jgi:ketopantoate reductase